MNQWPWSYNYNNEAKIITSSYIHPANIFTDKL